MPFKTKRQKVSAAARRYTFVDGKVTLEGVYKKPAVENAKVTVDLRANDALLTGEIGKILIISLSIVCAQVAVYFML